MRYEILNGPQRDNYPEGIELSTPLLDVLFPAPVKVAYVRLEAEPPPVAPAFSVDRYERVTVCDYFDRGWRYAYRYAGRRR